MSFKNITPEEYQRLINNKNRIFDLIFKTPEVLNKYRNDKDIYEEIKYIEKQNKKLKDYDKVFHENLDKYFIENDDKKKIEEVSRYNYNILKKKEKELEDKDKELTLMNDMLEDKSDELKQIKNAYMIREYSNKYKFDNDEDIINSFKTIYKENIISYKPYSKSKSKYRKIKYLLDNLENNDGIDKNLINYFKDNLFKQKKLTIKFLLKI